MRINAVRINVVLGAGAAALALALAAAGAASAQTKGTQDAAAQAGGADIKCSDPLPDCTKQRVAQLRALARGLGNAAAVKPTEKVEPEQKEQLERFDKWLRSARADALRLATMGEKAKGEGTQRAFNLQYLALQDTVRTESRKFQTISTIMKKKHDVAMTSIRNVK
jgi:hypothetical protein